MMDSLIQNIPKIHEEIERKSNEIGFTMSSDLYVGTLLKTLISSKPKSNVLELGTGIGRSLSWMCDGMDADSKIISVDNDPKLIAIAQQYFGSDARVQLVCADGSEWIQNYKGEKFDLIFADAWPGKYSDIDAVLALVKVGGFYVVDDMTQQPNWPEGHENNVNQLIRYLENRNDMTLTKMNWSTGLIIAARNY
ncbi:class I SAM-dependent methyltransferase [Arenibacter sp. GZD96]|uniref:O-methyltransferase n=1 Tax=Aurantibrevibacter litoralis TaxID=3106030 RepID=UPI002AFF9D6B|nr:class I SAM-dependent methyltransferase [Arenibacter sp. GZD-96]MEA1785247.1 class I SAM-dependent methyltransferase [Arenibacter sp. GZD-96]